MRWKASSTSFAAALFAALALVAPAFAAAPKLPLRGKEYTTNGYQGGVSVNLVTNATNAKIVQPGPAQVFGLFAKGGIYIQCPTAPKSSRGMPIAPIPFPSFTLRLSHGHYVFSTSVRGAVTLLASRRTSPVAVKVALTGTVLTSKLIKGSVKVSGALCKRTTTYTATLNPAARVEPGQ